MISRLTRIGAAGAIALAALFVSVTQARAQDALDAVRDAEGHWDWATTPDEAAEARPAGRPDQPCLGVTMQIWMSEDGRRFNSQWSGEGDEIATGPVLLVLPERDGFMIRYDGEDRLDPEGNPVSWILLMTSRDSFVWVRRDWVGTGGSTRPMVRCEADPIG